MSDAPRHRPWTVMVYMAGDNGKTFNTTQYGAIQLMASMTGQGYEDLSKMATVGTTDQVALSCLFDTTDGSYQVEVCKGPGFAGSVVTPLAEVNTGDPATLSKFITQSIQKYPADHYMLVIWNHGAGWLDVDAYAVVRALPGSKSYSPIFRTTPQKLTGGDRTRPIAFDDSSKDFLDTADLRQAFADAEQATGARLNVIGMDACLMAMVEGDRELAPYADYFVASQEVEPMAGWPYAQILTQIDATPGISPADVAVTVVEEYAKSYGGTTRAEATATQAAVVLARTDQTETLCKALVDCIMANQNATVQRLVAKAANQALAFEDANYRDLGDFAAQLADLFQWESYPAITDAATLLRDHLATRSDSTPVLRVGYVPSYARATGMSVYLPADLPRNQLQSTLKIYNDLYFPQRTGWDKLVAWLLGG